MCASPVMTLRELSAMFPRPSERTCTDRSERTRGRRIATDLGCRIVNADGLEFVVRADVVEAINRQAVAA